MTLFNYALAALGATITATTTTTGYPATQAIDGTDITAWRPGANQSNTYLTIDLGAAEYITAIRCLTSGISASAAYWQLHYSLDGANWNPLEIYFDRLGDLTVSFEAITAQYWRLYHASTTSNPPPYVYSFEVIGPIEAPPPPTNPADDYIAAWLDGIETHYVPAVQDWLAAN